MYKNYIKPTIDKIFAFTTLVFLSPILLFTGLILTWANKGNPFFIQERPGKNEQIFKIVKFKTMTDQKDNKGVLLPDEQRLTYLGNFVRKTSLDEVPQLWNVLKGEMSLVGPRPLLPEYLSLYSTYQKKRHLVKPGITGWAQVNGRNAISWNQKFNYDVWYVENLTYALDFKILFQTIKKVIISEGINTENMATTEPFNGKN